MRRASKKWQNREWLQMSTKFETVIALRAPNQFETLCYAYFCSNLLIRKDGLLGHSQTVVHKLYYMVWDNPIFIRLKYKNSEIACLAFLSEGAVKLILQPIFSYSTLAPDALTTKLLPMRDYYSSS